MRTITVEERRHRLGLRHGLALPLTTVEEAAAAMVGLHSSDPATVYLSARARLAAFAVVDLEDALYERRSLLRMLGMRRTMFVVPRDLAAVMDAACTRALWPAERRRLITMLADQGIAADGEAWLARVEEEVMASLVARGEAVAKELTADVPELANKIRFGEGKTWTGAVGVSTRVLFLLATAGRIVRGRPLGSWVSSQYRWAPVESWIDGGLPELDRDEASAELVRRWLHAFGPGTFTDLKWWTGWKVGQSRKALAAAGAIEVDLGQGAGYVLADDLEPATAPAPWVALLPSLDPTVMGWKERGWYLGGHAPRLFDRNGNAGPTVWCDGRVVGGWGHLPDGRVAVHLLEDVGSAARKQIDAEATALAEWLGGVRLKARFPTPIERELAGRA